MARFMMFVRSAVFEFQKIFFQKILRSWLCAPPNLYGLLRRFVLSYRRPKFRVDQIWKGLKGIFKQTHLWIAKGRPFKPYKIMFSVFPLFFTLSLNQWVSLGVSEFHWISQTLTDSLECCTFCDMKVCLKSDDSWTLALAVYEAVGFEMLCCPCWLISHALKIIKLCSNLRDRAAGQPAPVRALNRNALLLA